MNRLVSSKLVLVSLVIGIPFQGLSQLIYSQNFDSGTPGESLTDPQFGFNLHTTDGGGGDLKLGPAQHGWTGNSVIGNDADLGQINFLYKTLAIPLHGIVEFSADLYSGTVTGSQSDQASAQDVGIELESGSPDSAGTNDFDLRALNGYWGSDDSSLGRNFWDSPAGMHFEPVLGSIFWNQDTGEHWAEVTDGVQTFYSPHVFAPGLGPMDTISLYIDRRNSNPVAGDIDKLTVQMVPGPAPEPVTVSLGLVGVGIALRKKLKPIRGQDGAQVAN